MQVFFTLRSKKWGLLSFESDRLDSLRFENMPDPIFGTLNPKLIEQVTFDVSSAQDCLTNKDAAHLGYEPSVVKLSN